MSARRSQPEAARVRGDAGGRRSIRPRRGVPAALALTLFAALGAPAPATEVPAAGGQGGAAALMRAVEERFRALPRALRLEVVTTRPREQAGAGLPEREEVGLWGLVGDRGGETSLLFVFTGPRRMRGTGLLLVDRPGGEDALWYHMKTFDRFKRIPRSSLKLRVPGTCLTYEDAHGFFAADRYRFSPVAVPAEGGDAVIDARPRTPELADDLGFASARVTVDRDRLLVTGVDYRRADGRTLRTYRAGAALRLGGAPAAAGELWLARRARVVDVDSGVVSALEYFVWPLPEAPEPALFATRVEEEPLLDRMVDALAAWGIADAATARNSSIRAVTAPSHQGGSQ